MAHKRRPIILRNFPMSKTVYFRPVNKYFQLSHHWGYVNNKRIRMRYHDDNKKVVDKGSLLVNFLLFVFEWTVDCPF